MITNQRKSYNRALAVEILALFVSAWVIINNYPNFTTASWIYVGLIIITIFMYIVWDKI